MQIRETYKDVKIRHRLGMRSSEEPFDGKLEFGSVRNLRNFINAGSSFVTLYGKTFKVIKMKKIRHSSIFANIKEMSRREYNLEILGI